MRSDKKHQHCKKFESVTSNIGLGNNSGNKGQTDEHDTQMIIKKENIQITGLELSLLTVEMDENWEEVEDQ